MKTLKSVVDTNVPITANLASKIEEVPEEMLNCVNRCIEVLEGIMQKGGLVLDYSDEIFNEYRRYLSLSGQPGVGDTFLKWTYLHGWGESCDRVHITPSAFGYEEFPDNPKLKKFDPADKKFIAVANAHKDNPIVYQATDSKWWNFKDSLEDSGIKVEFIDVEYIKSII